MSSTTGSISPWLQGSNSQSTPGDVGEASGFVANVSNVDRAKLKPKQSAKIRAQDQQSIPHKFGLINQAQAEDTETLTEVYKVSVWTETLASELRVYDLMGVF